MFLQRLGRCIALSPLNQMLEKIETSAKPRLDQFLSEHEMANKNRGQQAKEIRDQSGWQRMARVLD